MADTRCNTYELNQAFLDALEFMDDVIKDKSHETVKLYFNMIPRGVYPLGEGLVQKLHKFHGGLGDQAALTTWREIEVSRPPAGQDPGYDACRYEAERIDYAFETIDFTGFETSRRSVDVCLNDIKWTWQFQQQLALIFNFLSDITISVWENYGREQYLKMCADQGNIYILTDGAPNSVPLSATYDPFTSNNITIPRDIDIGTLQWDFMQWWHQFLSLQAPRSAIGMMDGMPQWGLVTHPVDFDNMIMSDPDLREDYRYASPNVLIEGYGTVKAFKGYALIYDMLAPRFKVASVTATEMVLERVLPYTTEATTIGSKPVIDPDYLNAEYAFGVIFLKNVYEILVPPSGPASPGGGTMFGAVPSLNGEFKWLNIQDRCENLLNEKGFYFSRFQAFAKPMDFHDEAIAFLYKRCPQTTVVGCSPCDGGTTGARTITAVERVVIAGETAALFTQVKITLDACLTCESPAEVGIDYGGGGSADVTGVLIDDSEAPIYKVAFATAADYIDAATIVAGTSDIVCS